MGWWACNWKLCGSVWLGTLFGIRLLQLLARAFCAVTTVRFQLPAVGLAQTGNFVVPHHARSALEAALIFVALQRGAAAGGEVPGQPASSDVD